MHIVGGRATHIAIGISDQLVVKPSLEETRAQVDEESSPRRDEGVASQRCSLRVETIDPPPIMKRWRRVRHALQVIEGSRILSCMMHPCVVRHVGPDFHFFSVSVTS